MNAAAEQYKRALQRQAHQAFADHQITVRSRDPIGARWVLHEIGADAKWRGNFWVEIVVLAGRSLLVHGDIAHVVFTHCGGGPDDPEHVLRWMGGHPDADGYVIGKARLGTGRELIDTTDDDVARAQIVDALAESIREGIGADAFDEARLLVPLEDDEDVLTDPPLGDALAFCATLRALTEIVDRLGDRDAADYDKDIEALLSAIEALDHGEPLDVVTRELFEAHGNGYEIIEHLGNVPAPRVYFAHAAVRRLCELLDAEAAKAKAEEIAAAATTTTSDTTNASDADAAG